MPGRSEGVRLAPALAAAAGAAVTAGAGIAALALAAVPAGAAPGRPAHLASAGLPAVITANRAGYAASGRRFRYAQAVIAIPAGACRTGHAAQPERYVALAGPRGYARVGLSCPARAGRWRAFASVTGPGGGGPVTREFGLRPVPGSGAVFVSAYFSRASGAVRLLITAPDGTRYRWSRPVGTAMVYNQAQALADWSGAAPAFPPPASTRVAWFASGGFTTAHGRRGTFQGPWTLSRWEATSNGLAPPRGRLVFAPGPLRADGTQRVIGGWADVFGVWRYP